MRIEALAEGESKQRRHVRVCALDDIDPDSGVCVLLDGRQVAVFRFGDEEVFALGNRDPFSGANVMARGIVGTRQGEPKVASPIYKQTFSLRTGACFDEPDVRLPTYQARVEEGFVVLCSELT